MNSPGNWKLRASFAKPPNGGYPQPPLAVSQVKAAVSTAGRIRATLPLGRGHRPWVEIAQNARQLDVAGFACQAPWRGLRLTAPAVPPLEGRSFQLLAAPRPSPFGRGHRPWVEAAQNARQLEVVGFACQAPLRGCAQPPPAVLPLEGRSFQLPAASSLTPHPAAPAPE